MTSLHYQHNENALFVVIIYGVILLALSYGTAFTSKQLASSYKGIEKHEGYMTHTEAIIWTGQVQYPLPGSPNGYIARNCTQKDVTAQFHAYAVDYKEARFRVYKKKQCTDCLHIDRCIHDFIEQTKGYTFMEFCRSKEISSCESFFPPMAPKFDHAVYIAPVAVLASLLLIGLFVGPCIMNSNGLGSGPPKYTELQNIQQPILEEEPIPPSPAHSGGEEA